MLIKEEIYHNVNYLKLGEPRCSDDFNDLMEALNKLLVKEKFSIIFEVEGPRHFNKEQKRDFGKWFKQNKKLLGLHCKQFIRINNNPSKLSKLSSKALSLAMPCPYKVVESLDEARPYISV